MVNVRRHKRYLGNLSMKKEKIIDFLISDISGEDQEYLLRSRASEMEEDYLERLGNHLSKFSFNKLLKMAKAFGY